LFIFHLSRSTVAFSRAEPASAGEGTNAVLGSLLMVSAQQTGVALFALPHTSRMAALMIHIQLPSLE